MTLRRLTALPLFLLLLWPGLTTGVLAENVMAIGENGKCTAGFFPFQGVCVRVIDTSKKEKVEEVMSEIREFKRKSISSGNGFTAIKCIVEKDEGEVYFLNHDIIVHKTGYEYVGYIGYRKGCVLFNGGSGWKLAIEDKDPFKVEILKAPTNKLPSLFPRNIEVAKNGILIIGGNVYKSQGFCSGWSAGDAVIFLDGSAGVCVTAKLLNLKNDSVCNVWCN